MPPNRSLLLHITCKGIAWNVPEGESSPVVACAGIISCGTVLGFGIIE